MFINEKLTSYHRNYKLESIEGEVAKHSEKILHFLKKFVDGSGKWILKSPLKESDKREIHHITEEVKVDMNSLQKTLQEEFTSNSTNTATAPDGSSSEILKNAVLFHVSCLPLFFFFSFVVNFYC